MPKVILAEEIGKEFGKLEERAEKGDDEAKYLLKIINKGVAKLAQKPSAGKHLPKRLWPAEYVRKYGITNLWKLNLDNYWRMIYTLRGNQPEIIAFVIDVLDHKKYDRKFGYRT